MGGEPTGRTRMRITAVETVRPHVQPNLLFVRLHTDVSATSAAGHGVKLCAGLAQSDQVERRVSGP
jgi:hypothetical protein